MAHYLHEVREMLCEELEKISEEGKLSAGTLDLVDKLTHSIKSIDTIIAMDSYGEYSEEGSSYARRKRDSMGRYSREGRGGYSRDGYSYRDGRRMYSREDSKEHMLMELHELMDDASGEAKEAIKKAIKQIENA